MIKVKYDVTPKNLVIAAAVANIADELDITVVITSGTDGFHMATSKHYTGDALDLRRFNMEPVMLALFLVRLKERLGRNYDVILEKDHIHCEYDPK